MVDIADEEQNVIKNIYTCLKKTNKQTKKLAGFYKLTLTELDHLSEWHQSPAHC